MARVQDVAAYILKVQGPMTAMKLQKLVFYSYAWHLVWDERPLFDTRIEAWSNGPVSPELYRMHRGMFQVAPNDIPGDPDKLDPAERGSIDAVLNTYGAKPAHWLSELSHRERPWSEARESAGLQPMDRGSAVIEPAVIFEYYDGLTSANTDE